MNKTEFKGKLQDNELPERWTKIKLGEIIIENIKSRFKVENADNSGRYPFFTSGEAILSDSNYLVDYENVFLATGGVANIKYYKGKANYSADTYCLKTKITTKYLYYFLLKNLVKIDYKYFSGSGLKHLQKNDFKKEILILPSLPREQQKIADILETVDETIEKTDTIIEKYRRIKQGLMKDLLIKGIDENGKIRSEKTHKFKDSQLGRIPEEWEVKRIIDAIGVKTNLIIAGPFGSNLKVSDYKKSGIPLIRLQNIEENKFINKDIKYISKKKSKELYYHSFRNGDIVLAKLGNPVGKTCIIPKNLKFGIVVADVVRIRVIDEYADKEFITYILNFNTCRKRLNMEIIGTTRPRVNLTQIRSLQLPLPPIHEQQRIAGILSQIDETIEKERNYKEKLERIKQGLMEDLLTGKLRVLNVN